MKKFKATLRWARKAVVDRILYKRDEANRDHGFLAGLDTALAAVEMYPHQAELAIREARKGHEHEMQVRRRD